MWEEADSQPQMDMWYWMPKTEPAAHETCCVSAGECRLLRDCSCVGQSLRAAGESFRTVVTDEPVLVEKNWRGECHFVRSRLPFKSATTGHKGRFLQLLLLKHSQWGTPGTLATYRDVHKKLGLWRHSVFTCLHG